MTRALSRRPVPPSRQPDRPKWYAAHVITVFRYRNHRQRKFHVWENIVLVQASSSREAWDMADQLARREAESDDPSTRFNGFPAKQEYVGLRKVVECQESILDPRAEFGHGTEVTCNKFNVASKADLQKLIAGAPVTVEYEE